MRFAFQYGLTPQEFWNATPFETRGFIKAHLEHEATQRKIEVQHMVWATWFGAYWQRVKRMPKFNEALGMWGIKTENKKQSADDMLAFAKQITVAMGGKINKLKTDGGK